MPSEGEHQRLLHQQSSSLDPPPEELKRLLEQTNFTEREIVTIYRNAASFSNKDEHHSGGLTKSEFATVCFDQGVTSPGLVGRMWEVMDADGSGFVEPSEVVISLNPLMRGSRDDVARFFFDLYEIDGDGELSPQEIAAVYSEMLQTTHGPADGNDLATEAKDESSQLSSAQKRRIARWVQEQRDLSDSGRLDKEAFVKAIEDMDRLHPHEVASLCTLRSWVFIILTSLFEFGASYTYFAVGALAAEFKERFDITDSGIGELMSMYFIGAIIGPFLAGIAMDKVGPGPIQMLATFFVFISAFFHVLPRGPETYWVLMFGRFLLGMGGDSAPFLSVEILGRLFPDHLGTMAGVRNLVQSTNGFLSFVLLPLWYDWLGMDFALWMCVLLSGASFAAATIVVILMRKEEAEASASAEKGCDQTTVLRNIRALSTATTPDFPNKWDHYLLPASFFFACIGIQAQYFCPLVFTSFSIRVYMEKFGTTDDFASLQTGLINLIAGFLGPAMGTWSDKVGKRAEWLAIFTFIGAMGFVVLALGDHGPLGAYLHGPTTVAIATILFAIQYGFGDTVSYVSIRFIVGPDRAGLGYGVYSLVANLLTTVVSIVAGDIMDQPDVGTTNILWFFFGLTVLGFFCWLIVLVLEGSRSLLELPNDKIIETSDDDLRKAALTSIVGPAGNSLASRPESTYGSLT